MKTTASALPDFIGVEEIRRLSGLGRSTIYDMVKRGELPKPQHLGGRRVARWRRVEVEEALGLTSSGVAERAVELEISPRVDVDEIARAVSRGICEKLAKALEHAARDLRH